MRLFRSRGGEAEILKGRKKEDNIAPAVIPEECHLVFANDEAFLISASTLSEQPR